jgi:hypothetical protein
MSEEAVNESEATETVTEGSEPSPTETVEFWKQKAREQEKRAKDNSAAAKRLSELEEAQKSETEKAADRIAKAEAEAQTVPAKVAASLREHLVTLHEFDPEDAELFLTAIEPELLLKQVTRLLGQSDKRQRKNHVPREGENPSAASSDEAAFARGLLGG